MFFNSVVAFGLLSLADASAVPRQSPAAPSSAKPAYTLRDVWRFPNGTWIENLAVRATGELLTTLITDPMLYQVDPTGKLYPQPIHQFPDVNALTGIAEVEPDVFAVAAGNWSDVTANPTPGIYGGSAATVKKVADLHDAGFLNGLTPLPSLPGSVIVSDSLLGVVWRVDTLTGKFVKVIDDPSMKPAPGPVPLGINGIKIRDNTLYYPNFLKGEFYRIPITTNGSVTAPATLIANQTLGDDFAFAKDGRAFVAQDFGNALILLNVTSGVSKTIVGNINSTELVGPTSAQFGRTAKDLTTLHIVTNGGMAGAALGQTYQEGGKVVALETRGL